MIKYCFLDATFLTFDHSDYLVLRSRYLFHTLHVQENLMAVDCLCFELRLSTKPTGKGIVTKLAFFVFSLLFFCFLFCCFLFLVIRVIPSLRSRYIGNTGRVVLGNAGGGRCEEQARGPRASRVSKHCAPYPGYYSSACYGGGGGGDGKGRGVTQRCLFVSVVLQTCDVVLMYTCANT